MKESISKKQLREFGLLVGFGFPLIIGWIIPVIGGHLFKAWTLGVGLPLLVLGIFAPNTLIYPYKFWMNLGLILGWINSRIILGIIFIFILEPISLVMRLIGYDPLRLKKISKKTYKENKKNHKIDLKRIF
tara:strand:+ start:2042 stop:2434 length:393 start_codon:yes stop_codon:yes gene_type:complete